ncbi:septum site-determining protein Ssd [Nocardia sp. NPDC057668]|uniref:septum site-determining protein Ssd n=1 Tax=Nocardia sp. NPDC057668 TaxID=3346202 RepID=UPI00366D8CB4
MNSRTAVPPRALALVSGARLRDEVRRIAAAADHPLDEPGGPPARHAWSAASVIVLDAAAARSCAAAGCPRRPGILLVSADEPGLPEWQAATEVGAEQVLSLPRAADALIAAFAAHDARGPGDGAVIAVAGACGGAGASTLAAAVALAAAVRQHGRTLLVDAAPFGGGLDLLLGLERTPGLRWPDLVIENGRVSAAALHEALPGAAGAAVLSCGRATPAVELAPAAVRAVVEAGRAAGDLVVCDLSTERGPHADHILDTADLVILLVPARLRATAAAEAVGAHLTARNPQVSLVVRGPAPGGLRAGEMARALELPLLVAVPPQPGLAGRLESTGLTLRRRGPLRLAAESVLAALERPDRRARTPAVPSARADPAARTPVRPDVSDALHQTGAH